MKKVCNGQLRGVFTLFFSALFISAIFLFTPLNCKADADYGSFEEIRFQYYNNDRAFPKDNIKRIIFLSKGEAIPDGPLEELINTGHGINMRWYYENSTGTVYAYCPYDRIVFRGSDTWSGSGAFYGLKSLKEVQFGDKIDASNAKHIQEMFMYCENLEKIDLSKLNFENVETMEYLFNFCYNLKEIKFGKINTSNVTSMKGCFNYCESLESLDLSSFDTSNVTNMSYMFHNCKNLKSIDFVNDLDTSNVTSMYRMFHSCESLESVDLSRIDTSSLTNMYEMFGFCKNLKAARLSFDTKKVTNTGSVFYCSENLKYVDVSDLEFESGSTNLFYANKNLEVVLSPRVLTEDMTLRGTFDKFVIDDNNDGVADTSTYYYSMEPARSSHRYVLESKLQSSAKTNSTFPEEAFIYQGRGTTHCVVSSTTMMIKHRLYMAGDQSYKNVTKENVIPVALDSKGRQKGEFTYSVDGKNFNVSYKMVTNKDALISLLNEHPEGVVLYTWRKDNYKNQHAVLLTKCVDGEFYCVDPAIATFAETPLKDSTLIKGRYDSVDAMYNEGKLKTWFIKSCNAAEPAVNEPSPAEEFNFPKVETDNKKNSGATFIIGNNVYNVIADGEVTFTSIAVKKATCTIPAEVEFDGVTYKVTNISDNAFKNDKTIKKLTIGNSVVKIGKNAFSGCKNLKNIKIQSTALTKKTVGKNAFKGIHKKATVKVPKKVLKKYKKILKAKGLNGKSQKVTK